MGVKLRSVSLVLVLPALRKYVARVVCTQLLRIGLSIFHYLCSLMQPELAEQFKHSGTAPAALANILGKRSVLVV